MRVIIIGGEEGRQSFNSNYGMVLINRTISDDDIANALDFPDAFTARALLKRNLKSFGYVADLLCAQAPELNEKAKINYPQTKEMIKTMLIDFCKNSSQEEYEAYLAENMIAHKQGFEEKGSEVAYRYHKLIVEGLNKENQSYINC